MFWTLKQLARREIAEWRRLADIRAFEQLTDHQLDDIGLRRDQLFLIEARGVDEHLATPAPVYQPGFEPCG